MEQPPVGVGVVVAEPTLACGDGWALRDAHRGDGILHEQAAADLPGAVPARASTPPRDERARNAHEKDRADRPADCHSDQRGRLEPEEPRSARQQRAVRRAAAALSAGGARRAAERRWGQQKLPVGQSPLQEGW